jgi:hypothetical protein
MLLLSRQWHPHTRHGNGSHILTKSTLDRLRPVRIHKRRTATTAVDMRHGRCFHSQIHGMTTGALHTSGTSHVHQQSPASSTYQLRHHLCSTMRRHTGDRATQGTSHITSSLWIYQQRMTASTYQLTLCSSCSSLHLLIRHHNNNSSSHLFSFLSLSSPLFFPTTKLPNSFSHIPNETLKPTNPSSLFCSFSCPSSDSLSAPCASLLLHPPSPLSTTQALLCFALLCVALRTFLPQCTHTRNENPRQPKDNTSFCFVFLGVFGWVVSIQKMHKSVTEKLIAETESYPNLSSEIRGFGRGG